MFVVREANAADRPEIEALIGEMIPGCDVPARWRWLYDTNPGGPAITWLAIAPTGEVAGCTSFFPFRLWLDGTELRAALGGDGYVRPAFRRRGLGGLLHEASRLAMPKHRITCMYGSPGAMNLTPLKHGGSREVGLVSRSARPLRGSALRVPAPLGGVVTRILRPRTRVTLSAMHAQDERLNAVWAEARQDLRLAAIRDAAFYTWRFREAPAQLQDAYVILDGDRPIGACALQPMFEGRSMRIVDVVAVPGRWHSCLGAIARFCSEHTAAQVVDIKLMALDARKRQMWRSGFLERETKPFLCMIPKDGDRRLVDPDRWFYCGGDSDLDSFD